jgi:hypothetical protein
MELPRVVIGLLVFIWTMCFLCFGALAFLAFRSTEQYVYEYRVFGIQLPYAEVMLLLGMASSSGLLWANYRGEDYRAGEQLIYGALFGISVFGLILGVPLVLFI